MKIEFHSAFFEEGKEEKKEEEEGEKPSRLVMSSNRFCDYI